MKTAAIAITTLAIGVIAGCASSAAAGPKGSSGTSITEIHLGDGTRCAVMDKVGNGGAALDCDWKLP